MGEALRILPSPSSRPRCIEQGNIPGYRDRSIFCIDGSGTVRARINSLAQISGLSGAFLVEQEESRQKEEKESDKEDSIVFLLSDSVT